VQRLIEDIVKISGEGVSEIAFVVGDFGSEVEAELLKIAENLGAKGKICYQREPLGTAHAILCAADSLDGNVIVAFADTIFKADFVLDKTKDGIIWVHQIDDPSMFGVVKVDSSNAITDFVEKPTTFVSDLAIIGIYYVRDGALLKKELQYLIDNNIKEKGEFQLTNALENMKNKGFRFEPGKVNEWLDCGNKNSTVSTHARVLEHHKHENLVDAGVSLNNALIIPPCYIGKSVKLVNSIVGPYVSIGDNTAVTNSVISNSIVQNNSKLKDANITNSMIGNFVEYTGKSKDLSIGDYSTEN
jgi:glucose-1-phosphate thymidylyltransferase